jgi:hypothetical protein
MSASLMPVFSTIRSLHAELETLYELLLYRQIEHDVIRVPTPVLTLAKASNYGTD